MREGHAPVSLRSGLTAMSVGTWLATGYENFMGTLIRRFGIACTAMIVAVSVFLSPANALAMLDCEVPQSLDTVHDLEHSHLVDASSAEQDADNQTHPADHCVAHACVVAVEALSIDPDSLHLNQSAGFRLQNNALVSGANPEGMLRPPRA